MASDEVDAFLRTRSSVVLATLDADGAPTAMIVGCRYEDGVIVVDGDDDVRAAVERDARVCAAVEISPSYYEIKGVSVHGNAEPERDGVRVVPKHITSFDFAKIRARPT